MSQRLQGFVIRKRRQELGWSQAGLCQGICAVSYLSKIEQGKAEGSPEVIGLLFQRLGIHWNDSPAFQKEAKIFLEACYDHLFSGEKLTVLAQTLRERGSSITTAPSSWIGCCCPAHPSGRRRKRWRSSFPQWIPGSGAYIWR